MHNPDKPYELRNIKKNPSGYQIQFIVNGKSYSDFSTNIEKAKRIRNKMERTLKIVPKGSLKRRAVESKLSYIPGTNKPMPTGITLHHYKHPKGTIYDVIVNWRDHTGKKRAKTFYGCSESRYTHKAMKAAYNRALAFSKAYEKATVEGTLDKLNPTDFNKKR